MSTFGQRVKERRLEAQMSASELARRAGISQPHMWRIETGEYEPQLSVAVAIAAALGASIAELAEAYCQGDRLNTSAHKQASAGEAKSGTGAAKSSSRKHKRISK